MKLTLAYARPFIAKAAGLRANDSRVVDYINRSIERLLPKGKWVGTIIRYRICINADCITWPRQIETIEAFAIEGRPRNVRNGWFEFLESGQGILKSTSNNGNQLVDRGDGHVTFDDITAGSWGYVRIYTDLPESSGKYITILGYDENGNWIRTLDGTEYIDGLKVAIQTSPATITTTTQKFSRITGVIKSLTNGNVRLYEFNGTSNVRALAIYEPDEELPSYRRSYVPGLRNINQGTGDCQKASVEIAGKLRYIPVSKENDFLIIGNLRALEESVRGLRAFENELIDKAYAFEARAVGMLDQELQNHNGDGAVVQVRFERDVGAAEVENVVSGYGNGVW